MFQNVIVFFFRNKGQLSARSFSAPQHTSKWGSRCIKSGTCNSAIQTLQLPGEFFSGIQTKKYLIVIVDSWLLFDWNFFLDLWHLQPQRVSVMKGRLKPAPSTGLHYTEEQNVQHCSWYKFTVEAKLLVVCVTRMSWKLFLPRLRVGWWGLKISYLILFTSNSIFYFIFFYHPLAS